MCSHEMEKLYEELRLSRKAYRDEYLRFHPNSAAICQIPKPYTDEALKMADELTKVLEKYKDMTAK